MHARASGAGEAQAHLTRHDVHTRHELGVDQRAREALRFLSRCCGAPRGRGEPGAVGGARWEPCESADGTPGQLTGHQANHHASAAVRLFRGGGRRCCARDRRVCHEAKSLRGRERSRRQARSGDRAGPKAHSAVLGSGGAHLCAFRHMGRVSHRPAWRPELSLGAGWQTTTRVQDFQAESQRLCQGEQIGVGHFGRWLRLASRPSPPPSPACRGALQLVPALPEPRAVRSSDSVPHSGKPTHTSVDQRAAARQRALLPMRRSGIHEIRHCAHGYGRARRQSSSETSRCGSDDRLQILQPRGEKFWGRRPGASGLKALPRCGSRHLYVGERPAVCEARFAGRPGRAANICGAADRPLLLSRPHC